MAQVQGLEVGEARLGDHLARQVLVEAEGAEAQASGLGERDIARLCRNAFEASWLPADDAKKYIVMVDDFVASA